MMEGPVNVYAIYYGDWSNESAGKAILANLFTNIGNTSYYKIQQTYTNAAGTPLSVTISFKGVSPQVSTQWPVLLFMN